MCLNIKGYLNLNNINIYKSKSGKKETIYVMVLLTFLRKKITVNWIIINRLYTNYGFSKKILFDMS